MGVATVDLSSSGDSGSSSPATVEEAFFFFLRFLLVLLDVLIVDGVARKEPVSRQRRQIS